MVSSLAATGGLLFGFDTGVISGALLLIKQAARLGAAAEEVVVSAVLVGAMLGAVIGGRLADRFGRRTLIIGAAVVFFGGSLGTALVPLSPATGVGWLAIGRVVIGVAIGVASVTVPLYIGEIAPSRVRGALVSLNQLAITVGILSSYLVDYLFASLPDGWRYMFLVGVIPALVLGLGMLFLPETPRFLVARRREEEAAQILSRTVGPDRAREALADIERTMARSEGGSWSELGRAWLRPPLIVGIGLMLIQQMTGINTVIYYAPTIFQSAGFHAAGAAILATTGLGVVNVAMTVVSIWLIDRVGRKPLLYGGLICMVASLGVLGLVYTSSAAPGGWLKWVVVGSLVVYIASFAVSLGPICWLIASEIYPLRVRGLAMSLATFANWAFNFIIALTFLSLVQVLGASWTFWLYGLVGIGGLLFSAWYVPETKGHTLEEIEAHWAAGGSPRQLK